MAVLRVMIMNYNMACVLEWIYQCVRVCLYVRVRVRMCACVYVLCVCARVYVYVSFCVHMYFRPVQITHMHTHITLNA